MHFRSGIVSNALTSGIILDQHVMAKEEAQHLFSETDTNKDMKLSYTEIVDKHQLWVGSQATDYGRQMHDNSEL